MIQTKDLSFLARAARTLTGATTMARAAAMLLAVMILTVTTRGYAQDVWNSGTEDDWTYNYKGGVAVLGSYNGTAESITTPTTLGGNRVTIISSSFSAPNTTLKSLTVSEGVAQIESGPFTAFSSLTTVSLPTSLVILGQRVFQYCSSLESIVVPANVQTIHESVFQGCTSLASVIFQGAVGSIERSAFENCSALKNITIPASVTEIADDAFYLSGLENVIYNGVKADWDNITVGTDAFSSWSNTNGFFTPTFHWFCMVTYDMQGHGTAPSSQQVWSNFANIVTVPTAPTATGYDFGGWYGDAACTEAFDFTAALDDNVTVYAKWTALENTIQFDLGGKGTAISNQTVTTGNTVTEPAVQFDGTDGIEGWYTDAGRTLKYDFTTAVDHSFTLYAKWTTAGTATITTNGEGGTATLTNAKGQAFNDGKVMPGVYTLTVTPASGYSFNGSYTLTERSGGASDMPYAFSGSSVKSYNIDLTAKDAAIEVTFSTQPILTVTTRADDESVLNDVTWSVVNNQTSATIANGDAIPYISDPNGAIASDFGIRLNVDLGSLSGYAFTATITDMGNGTTTYKNSNEGTSFLIVPHGSIDIDLYVYQPQTIALQDDGSNIDDIIAINHDVASVTLKRALPAGKKQTVCLPFAPEALLSLGTVWEFTSISDDKVVMTQKTSGLSANKPYIFEANANIDGETGINFGTVTINYGTDPKTTKSKKNEYTFTFQGTYERKHWEASEALAEGIYGFLSMDSDEGEVGQFVKCDRNTNIKPFRAYLKYEGELSGTQTATARRKSAAALPDVIDIVWVSASGATTGITTTNFTNYTNAAGAWYSLDGRRLSGKPTKRGMYLNNGKKIIIK